MAPSAPRVPAVAVGTGGGGAIPGQATVPFTAPVVTFGDGRTPAFLAETPEELPGRSTPRPLVKQAQPTAAATAAVAPPPRPALEPVAVTGHLLAVVPAPWPLSETTVTSLWGRVEPGWPAGLLFGIAGLLLAPIGGVWLGWRQARAARSASQLVG